MQHEEVHGRTQPMSTTAFCPYWDLVDFRMEDDWGTGDIGGYPSGKHTKNYWKWPFIVDLPIKNGDFP